MAEEINFDLESSSAYNILETFLKNRDQHKMIFEKECKDQFQDYRDIKKVEKNIYVSKKLSELTILQNLSQADFVMEVVATSLYPIAMWDDE